MAPKTLVAPEPSHSSGHSWQYLESRPHPWRRQLFVKGRRLLASSVWTDMIANSLTEMEIAFSRDLPVEAVRECVQYCEESRPLLDSEAEAEKQWLTARGIAIEPSPLH